MSKPLSEDEKKLLAQFIRGIIQGTVSLGFSSLGMLELYKRAQAARQSPIDILTSDPQVCLDLAQACKKGVAKLPAPVLIVFKSIVEEAMEYQQEVHTPVRPDGSDPDDP